VTQGKLPYLSELFFSSSVKWVPSSLLPRVREKSLHVFSENFKRQSEIYANKYTTAEPAPMCVVP
jgi:hypothetical protein